MLSKNEIKVKDREDPRDISLVKLSRVNVVTLQFSWFHLYAVSSDIVLWEPK
jgi:hypothetical protein